MIQLNQMIRIINLINNLILRQNNQKIKSLIKLKVNKKKNRSPNNQLNNKRQIFLTLKRQKTNKKMKSTLSQIEKYANNNSMS